MQNTARRLVAAGLCFSLLVLSPGWEASRALAAVVRTSVSVQPAGGLPVVPPSVGASGRAAARAGLSPVSLSGFLPHAGFGEAGIPGLSQPSAVLSEAQAAPSPARAVPAAAVSPDPVEAWDPAEAEDASPAGRVQAGLVSLADDLAEPLAESGRLEQAGDESASWIGTRLEDILSRRRSVEGDGLDAASVVDSSLSRILDGTVPSSILERDSSVGGRRSGDVRHGGSSSLDAGLVPSGTPERLQEPSAGQKIEESPAAQASVKKGVLARVWSRVTAPLRVLPDPERNRAFWRFLLTQCLVSVGLSFHNTALPNMVGTSGAAASNMSYARAAGWASQAAANVTTGPMIDRHPIQRTLGLTNLLRSAALISVPILFFHGVLSFPVLLAVLFGAGFLESVSFSAESVAQLRLMAGDAERYSKINAVVALCQHVVGVLAPLAAGSFIGWMDLKYGLLAGSALSYGIYGLVALGGAVLFWRWVRMPHKGIAGARNRLRQHLGGFKEVRAVFSGHEGEQTVLVVEVSRDPSSLQKNLTEFEGYPVQVVRRKGWRDSLKESTEGFRILWSNRYLRLATVLFPMVYILAVDSVLFVALPRLIQESLVFPASAVLTGIPVLGPVIAGLATKAGAFGLFLAARSLGLGLSTLWMMLRRPRSESDVREGELTPMEKDGRWTSILHGLGSLSLWGVFFLPGLWWSVGAIFVMAFLKGPAWVSWSSLEQKVLQENYPDSMGKVYSAISFYHLVLSIIGVLTFGLFLSSLSAAAAFIAAGVAMSAAGLLDFIEPYVVFPIARHRRPSK